MTTVTIVGAGNLGGAVAAPAGPLKRARELEALGFLQIGLAAAGKTPWTGGFTLTD